MKGTRTPATDLVTRRIRLYSHSMHIYTPALAIYRLEPTRNVPPGASQVSAAIDIRRPAAAVHLVRVRVRVRAGVR
eukprot:scaffold27102_cov57-Phaeocystis_antarctica.AAC.5